MEAQKPKINASVAASPHPCPPPEETLSCSLQDFPPSPTPVTRGLAPCPGRDSRAFLTSTHITFLVCCPLPVWLCLQLITHPSPFPHPTHPQSVPVLHPSLGVGAVVSAAPTTGCGQETSTLTSSLPCDHKQVAASCWAAWSFKEQGWSRCSQQAFWRLLLRDSSDIFLQRPAKGHFCMCVSS